MLAMQNELKSLAFIPSADVAALLHALLDIYERRAPPSPVTPSTSLRSAQDARRERGAGGVRRAIRSTLDSLPSYHSQTDPAPRQIANEQLQTLERAGVVKLAWQRGEAGHLLSSVTLNPDHADAVFKLINRTPIAARRAHLADLLLGERFRFDDWRLSAVQRAFDQLKAEKSPAPFSLSDDDFNRDLLAALAALDGAREETPYRVFSVRLFNDSKRFEELMGAVATLARRCQPEWRELTNGEILRELNLVANPDHLYLHGAWQLTDDAGQVMTLGEFHPSVGIPAMQALRLRRVTVSTSNVLCIENPTSFYELIRNIAPRPVGTQSAIRDPQSAICLWGNPSPACRQLLRCLPDDVRIQVWADIDYGGLNILAQLRERVNAKAAPYCMDMETLEAHARWARPLTPADVKNLTRLLRRPALADMRPLIAHMTQRGLKLEQEAVRSIAPESPPPLSPL